MVRPAVLPRSRRRRRTPTSDSRARSRRIPGSRLCTGSCARRATLARSTAATATCCSTRCATRRTIVEIESVRPPAEGAPDRARDQARGAAHRHARGPVRCGRLQGRISRAGARAARSEVARQGRPIPEGRAPQADGLVAARPAGEPEGAAGGQAVAAKKRSTHARRSARSNGRRDEPERPRARQRRRPAAESARSHGMARAPFGAARSRSAS